MHISIRYKILIVVGFLLLMAVGCYTYLATSIFRQEKTALLYDINHSTAVNTASQLRSNIVQMAEQVRVYVLSEQLLKTSPVRLPENYLRSANIKNLKVFEKDKPSWGEIPVDIKGQVDEAEKEGHSFWIARGATEQAFFLATRIEIHMGTATNVFVGVAELDPKAIVATLASTNLFTAYLVKKSGEVLLHFDRGEFKDASPVAQHPLLSTISKQGALASGVQSFEFDKTEWYGAYASVGIGGLYFISQANRSEVGAAIRVLIERSLLFGLIVVTATFLVSILFSKRLTRNLRRLTELAHDIGQGDLTKKIELNSRDEVQELALSFNRMIDDLKASREAIEKYNRELEDKVALRTEQLRETNAAIKDVQEKLLKASQFAVAGEVAGRTAHEVLNPLTAILTRVENSIRSTKSSSETPVQKQISEILSAWEADLAQGGMEGLVKAWQSPSTVKAGATLFEEDISNLKTLVGYWSEQQGKVEKDLSFVQGQAFRIQRIVDQMRALVRTSATKSVAHCHSSIREAINMMADYTKKQGITITEDLCDSNPMAYLNRDEFIQVLTNLIRNASQAILAGKRPDNQPGEIRIKTSCEGPSVYIDMIDNGPGIPEEKAEKIFEAGFTTKSPTEGTGLGLAICRRYARGFGGDVTLHYSEPAGRGTCFRITLPLHVQDELKEAV